MPPAPGWQTVLDLLETHRKEDREDHEKINVRIGALEAQNLIETAAAQARSVLEMAAQAAETTRRQRYERYLGGGRGLLLMGIALITAVKAWGLF